LLVLFGIIYDSELRAGFTRTDTLQRQKRFQYCLYFLGKDRGFHSASKASSKSAVRLWSSVDHICLPAFMLSVVEGTSSSSSDSLGTAGRTVCRPETEKLLALLALAEATSIAMRCADAHISPCLRPGMQPGMFSVISSWTVIGAVVLLWNEDCFGLVEPTARPAAAPPEATLPAAAGRARLDTCDLQGQRSMPNWRHTCFRVDVAIPKDLAASACRIRNLGRNIARLNSMTPPSGSADLLEPDWRGNTTTVCCTPDEEHMLSSAWLSSSSSGDTRRLLARLCSAGAGLFWPTKCAELRRADERGVGAGLGKNKGCGCGAANAPPVGAHGMLRRGIVAMPTRRWVPPAICGFKCRTGAPPRLRSDDTPAICASKFGLDSTCHPLFIAATDKTRASLESLTTVRRSRCKLVRCTLNAGFWTIRNRVPNFVVKRTFQIGTRLSIL